MTRWRACVRTSSRDGGCRCSRLLVRTQARHLVIQPVDLLLLVVSNISVGVVRRGIGIDRIRLCRIWVVITGPADASIPSPRIAPPAISVTAAITPPRITPRVVGIATGIVRIMTGVGSMPEAAAVETASPVRAAMRSTGEAAAVRADSSTPGHSTVPASLPPQRDGKQGRAQRRHENPAPHTSIIAPNGGGRAGEFVNSTDVRSFTLSP